ncbi:DUF397 domain-containing protein [Actinomadura sp. J1-007]|nr:DUF397 domain-containing protein [Actinomadura sp. J1-007]
MSAPDRAMVVWRKSSRSGGNGNCVEVAASGRGAVVRDSKHSEGAYLSLSASEWRALIEGVKSGRHDLA